MMNPWTPESLKIANALDNQVRLIGGCVRDALLNRPADDIDMASPLLPKNIMDRLTRAGIRNRAISLRHGVVEALINHQKFEITTLRRDTYPTRREEITFITDYAADTLRRDFTINALSMDIAGNIYDYTDGQKDLKDHRVRFIGIPAVRLSEDSLRALRYLRFWSLFDDKAPDISVINLFPQYCSGLLSLSRNRREKEFFKILMLPRVIQVLTILKQTGMLNIFVLNADIKSLERLLDTHPESPLSDRLFALGYHTDRKGQTL